MDREASRTSLMITASVLAVASTVALASSSNAGSKAGAPEEPSRSRSSAGATVHLLWNDAYHLFPASALPELRRQLAELFSGVDVSVQLFAAERGKTIHSYPQPCVNAVLSPAPPPSALPNNAMAAAVGEQNKGFSIFVFLPELLRTLRLPTGEWSPRETADLTRATTRVLAHELVHVLAPERGHADEGLMAAQLSRETLLRSEVHLDADSRRWAHAAAAEWTLKVHAALGRSEASPDAETWEPSVATGMPGLVPRI